MLRLVLGTLPMSGYSASLMGEDLRQKRRDQDWAWY